MLLLLVLFLDLVLDLLQWTHSIFRATTMRTSNRNSNLKKNNDKKNVSISSMRSNRHTIRRNSNTITNSKSHRAFPSPLFTHLSKRASPAEAAAAE
mmetsp:Transcript_2524/g.5177  ORF Transcript_2524/g.5177 Transcript_2524/m.5177 type:complete len:96 (+) Transcript_2524:455-742(+)